MSAGPPSPARPAPLTVGFLPLPGFSLLSLAGPLDALAAANEALGSTVYRSQVLSADGAAAVAACGTRVAASSWLGRPLPQALFVLSDGAPEAAPVAALAPLLQERAAAGAVLGGLGTGAVVLAAAGVLKGHRATLNWAYAALLAEAHADVVVSSRLYEMDRGRLSAAGGTAALDLFIAWLGQRHGERLVADLLAHFGLERLRAGDEAQRAPVASRVGGGSAKLAEAVALMEANIGEPLPTEDIARLVGVSRRQLERLFKQRLDELPSRYYAELRLQRARRLLQQTGQSILQIGLACGFSSGSHFSNAYRSRFGQTPREARSQRALAWRDGATTEPSAPGDTTA